MVQGSTDLCANTSCWPPCSTHPPQSGSSPRPSWSGPPTGGRAPCCWMSSRSTVRPSAVEEQDTSCKAIFFSLLLLLSFNVTFPLRREADDWSGVVDDGGAAGHVASALPVGFHLDRCSFVSNGCVPLLTYPHWQRGFGGGEWLVGVSADWWRLVWSCRLRLCHGSAGWSWSSVWVDAAAWDSWLPVQQQWRQVGR